MSALVTRAAAVVVTPVVVMVEAAGPWQAPRCGGSGGGEQWWWWSSSSSPDARGARVEHGEKRRYSVERRAVADARGTSDHGAPHKSTNHRGKGAVHTRHADHHLGLPYLCGMVRCVVAPWWSRAEGRGPRHE